MPDYRKSRRLFARYYYLFFRYKFAEKLKTDRSFYNIKSVMFGYPVHQSSRGDASCGIPFYPFAFDVIIVKKREDNIRLDKLAVFVKYAVSVGIAVRRKPYGDFFRFALVFAFIIFLNHLSHIF